jgi:hypothetical protein
MVHFFHLKPHFPNESTKYLFTLTLTLTLTPQILDQLKFYKASGDLEKYNTYLAKYRQQTDHNSLRLLADLYESLNENDLALKCRIDATEQIFSNIHENITDQKATKKLLKEGKSIINSIETRGLILYTHTAQYELAVQYFNESLNFQTKFFPTHYEERAVLLKDIAMCYVKMNIMDTALSFFYQAIEILKTESLSSDKRDIRFLELYECIEYCYESKHNDYFSTYYYKKSLQIYKKLSADKLLYNDVENQSLKLGLTNLSLDYCQHKLKILEDCFSNIDDQSMSDDHIMLAIITFKYQIAILYQEKSEFNISLNYFKQELERQVEHFPEDECFIDDIYNAMAWNLCLSRENLELAIDYCTTAISIYEHELKTYDFDFAHIVHTLSYLHYKHRHYSNAVLYCTQALTLAKTEISQKNESLFMLTMCYELLGNIERNKGYLPNAFKYYLRAFNSIRNLKSNHIKHIKRLQNKINSLNETNIASFILD